MDEGLKKFADPQKALLALIAEKRAALTAAHLRRRTDGGAPFDRLTPSKPEPSATTAAEVSGVFF